MTPRRTIVLLTVLLLALGAATGLAGCASQAQRSAAGARSAPSAVPRGGGYYQDDGPPDLAGLDLSQIPQAVPRQVTPSKYGNPTSYSALGKTYHVLKSAAGFTQTGIASWYGRQFHGERTSSGEPYSMFQMTAAHKRLPIPCYVQVTNLDNDRQIIVKINDRGPFKQGRIIDLSYVAARRLGIVAEGSAPVRIRTVTPDTLNAVADASQSTSHPPEPPRKRRPAASAVDPDGVVDGDSPTHAYDLASADADAKHYSATRAIQVKPLPAAATGAGPNNAALFLQTGAFGQPANAQRLQARLHSAGVGDVDILAPGEIPLYRVRVGPFASATQMAAARRRLADRGFDARVVKR